MFSFFSPCTQKKMENGWVVQNLVTPKVRMFQGIELKIMSVKVFCLFW